MIANVVALLLAGIFLLLIVPKYESSAPIEMAKFDAGSTGELTKVIEVPELLIERLHVPTSYTDEVSRLCDLLNEDEPHERIKQLITLSALKGVNAVVNLSVRQATPDMARQCFIAVFEMIRKQQADLFKPTSEQINKSIAVLRNRLNVYQARLSENDNLSIQPLVYLATRDESLFLMGQIESLERKLTFADTRLVTPVYTNEKPVYPRKELVLAMAVVSGTLLGLVLSMILSRRRN